MHGVGFFFFVVHERRRPEVRGLSLESLAQAATIPLGDRAGRVQKGDRISVLGRALLTKVDDRVPYKKISFSVPVK